MATGYASRRSNTSVGPPILGSLPTYLGGFRIRPESSPSGNRRDRPCRPLQPPHPEIASPAARPSKNLADKEVARLAASHFRPLPLSSLLQGLCGEPGIVVIDAYPHLNQSAFFPFVRLEQTCVLRLGEPGWLAALDRAWPKVPLAFIFYNPLCPNTLIAPVTIFLRVYDILTSLHPLQMG